MSKTRVVNEEKQIIETLRQCLRDMSGKHEITESAETPFPESSGDPLADLRAIAKNAVVIDIGDHYRRQK